MKESWRTSSERPPIRRNKNCYSLSYSALGSDHDAKALRNKEWRRVVWFIPFVALAMFLALAVILRPVPELTESFGASANPPADETFLFASVTVRFPVLLHRLVVLKDVEFRDSSGTYTFVDAWLNTGGGGGVLFSETLDEYPGINLGLIDVRGRRIYNVYVSIMLKLQVNGTQNSSRQYAGPNTITLKYTYAGWPITTNLAWDPNDR